MDAKKQLLESTKKSQRSPEKTIEKSDPTAVKGEQTQSKNYGFDHSKASKSELSGDEQ